MGRALATVKLMNTLAERARLLMNKTDRWQPIQGAGVGEGWFFGGFGNDH
jgi:hypothetical protein